MAGYQNKQLPVRDSLTVEQKRMSRKGPKSRTANLFTNF